MTNAISRRSAGSLLVGGGALLAILLTLVIPGFTPWSPPAAGANPPPGGGSNAQCATQVHYYAYESAEGWNNFGSDPKVTNVGEAVKSFEDRMCTDPLFASTISEFFANGENLDPAVAEKNAAEFVKNPDAWRKQVADVRTQVKNIELVNIDQRYDSLGMIRGANPQTMPKLTKFAELPLMGQSAKVTLDSGEVRELRVPCGFQPSVPKTFTKVTPPQPAPQPEQSQPPQNHPVCTVNCVPVTQVCPPDMPHGTWPVCKDGVDRAPQNQGNLPQQQMPNVLPAAPQYTQPVQPDVPPATNVAPAAPAPQPAPVGNEPAPNPNPAGPRYTAPPEQAAPAPSEAPSTCVPAPGMTTC